MVTKSKKRSKASNRNNTTAKKTLIPIPAQPANGTGSSPSNLDMLRRMYSAMLKCRMMEERARDGNAAVAYDLTTGHEAVAIGASIDLKPEDTIAASHCNFAARAAQRLPGGKHRAPYQIGGADLIRLRQDIGGGRGVGGLYHLYIPAAHALGRAGNRNLHRDLIARQGILEGLLHGGGRPIAHLAARRDHNHVELLAGHAFAGRGQARRPAAHGLCHRGAVTPSSDRHHAAIGGAPGYRPVGEGATGGTGGCGGQRHALAQIEGQGTAQGSAAQLHAGNGRPDDGAAATRRVLDDAALERLAMVAIGEDNFLRGRQAEASGRTIVGRVQSIDGLHYGEEGVLVEPRRHGVDGAV